MDNTNTIILLSSTFGSIYIFSESLKLLNKSNNNKCNIIINGAVCIFSGYMIVNYYNQVLKYK